MALNIKNPEVESLATELAGVTGESKTEAIRQALVERRARLRFRSDRRPGGVRVTSPSFPWHTTLPHANLL